MRNFLQSILILAIMLFAVPLILIVSAEDGRAQGCIITVTKVAPGAEGQSFDFNGVEANGETFSFSIIAGGSASGSASTAPATITEVPVEGWKFGGIECEPGGGVAILDVLKDGWVEECETPSLETFCIVTNLPAVSPIPTLSQWGMISAAAGLGLVGVFFAVRRKRAQAV